MNYTRTVLKNGLRIITIPMPSFESATVLVMVGAGSRYETKTNSGISHFLEHMAFKGTKKRPSAMAISSLIDGIGGEFNAFTGKETTGYYIKAQATHTDLMLDVLSDMLQNLLLDPVEIEKEKGVIAEELNLYEDTPARKIGDLYETLLYGDTPLGWDIGGEKEIIKKIMRNDFISYMDSLYAANNLTVVVAGGVKPKEVEQMVEKYFRNMRMFDTLQYEKVVENQKKPAFMLRAKKTEQVHLAVGVRTSGYNSPDRYPLAVLSSILGGGMSSRLFEEVREKRGLGYYVRTHSDNYQDCGSFVSMAGVDPKRALDAVKVILEEHHKLKSGKAKYAIKKEELAKAKEYIKGHMVLELEDSRSVASHYASEELLEDKIHNPDEILQDIDRVTIDQIESAIQKYFLTPQLNLAVIGNFKTADKKKFETLLQL